MIESSPLPAVGLSTASPRSTTIHAMQHKVPSVIPYLYLYRVQPTGHQQAATILRVPAARRALAAWTWVGPRIKPPSISLTVNLHDLHVSCRTPAAYGSCSSVTSPAPRDFRRGAAGSCRSPTQAAPPEQYNSDDVFTKSTSIYLGGVGWALTSGANRGGLHVGPAWTARQPGTQPWMLWSLYRGWSQAP